MEKLKLTGSMESDGATLTNWLDDQSVNWNQDLETYGAYLAELSHDLGERARQVKDEARG